MGILAGDLSECICSVVFFVRAHFFHCAF